MRLYIYICTKQNSKCKIHWFRLDSFCVLRCTVFPTDCLPSEYGGRRYSYFRVLWNCVILYLTTKYIWTLKWRYAQCLPRTGITQFIKLIIHKNWCCYTFVDFFLMKLKNIHYQTFSGETIIYKQRVLEIQTLPRETRNKFDCARCSLLSAQHGDCFSFFSRKIEQFVDK